MATLDTLRAKQKVDRRLLILYGLLVVILAVALTYITWDVNKTETARAEFENAVIKNCQIGQKNTIAFNNLIDQLIKSVQTNPAYSEADKKARIDFFETGRQSVPVCPPVALNEEKTK